MSLPSDRWSRQWTGGAMVGWIRRLDGKRWGALVVLTAAAVLLAGSLTAGAFAHTGPAAPTIRPAPAPAAPGSGPWSERGPVGGEITAIAVDPVNPNILYAATYPVGGVYKSSDRASTWTRTSFPSGRNLTSIAV